MGESYLWPSMRAGVSIVTQNRSEALARLDVFVGEWALEVRFPAGPQAPPGAIGEGPRALSRFEWDLERQFLVQRTEVPIPQAPDSLAIVSTDLETGAYTQHYYDSRGVVRLYAMSLADGVWTLTRESPDFTPLDFRQRYTGTFSQDGNTIAGAWEKAFRGAGPESSSGLSPESSSAFSWEHDFALTYRRVG
jgi:hypothetical protein